MSTVKMRGGALQRVPIAFACSGWSFALEIDSQPDDEGE